MTNAGSPRTIAHAHVAVDDDGATRAIRQAFCAHPGIPRSSVVLRVPALTSDEDGKVRRDALVRDMLPMPRHPAS